MLSVWLQGGEVGEAEKRELVRADHLYSLKLFTLMLTEREPSCSVDEVCFHRLLHIREQHMKKAIKKHFKDS